MKYGDKIEFFENVEAEGGHIPALDERPRLYDDLVVDFNVFIELSESRDWDSMSGIPKSLSFSEIESYMRLHRITDEYQQLRLLRRIKFMDSVFCSYYRKKHGRHSNKAGRKRRDSAGRKT